MQNLTVLDEAPSTNDCLKDLLANTEPTPEFTAIMARHQSRGKGQRGAGWLVDPGQNLTFSLLLRPAGLSADRAFNLNMLVCLAIRQWLAGYLPGVRVKWPNDIYVRDRKIGGVLLENQLAGRHVRSSVIGIGINLNQTVFPAELQKKATSLLLERPGLAAQDPQACCLSLLGTIREHYQRTDISGTQALLERYNPLLYRKDELAAYEVNGHIREGIVREAAPDGRLAVEFGGERRYFGLKGIRFVESPNPQRGN